MRRSFVLAAMLAFSLLASVDPVSASPQAVIYHLSSDATVQAGCLPPCLCPVLFQQPFSGTFQLEPDAFDGTFQHYRVTDVFWAVGLTDVPVAVTGSGTYRVAGDQQQLVLDLSVGGAQPRRWNSGLTGGGLNFPNIRLPIGLHGLTCQDTVFGVDASSKVTDVPEPPAPAFAFALGPNPFRGTASITFSLPRGDQVSLRIHDLAGRELRSLATGHYTAGPHTLVWDGRDANGRRVSAGVYYVRLRGAGYDTRGTLVKLE
jgi:hypothetical protein